MRAKGVHGLIIWALGSVAFHSMAAAMVQDGATSGPVRPAPAAQEPARPPSEPPIVSDESFEEALPPLSSDLNAPLEPLPSQPSSTQSAPAAPATDAAQAGTASPAETIPDAPVPEPAELSQPLPPIEGFEATPTGDILVEGAGATLRYDIQVEGLDAIGLEDQFRQFSALEKGDGRAATAAMVAARAREDEALVTRLMTSRGYFDGTALAVIEQQPGEQGRIRVRVTATPGERYSLGAIRINHGPVLPPGLIRNALPIKTGDPIEAERIQGAEANLSVVLPENGYPFAEIGQRDILLDESTMTGDYTLPVETGPRSTFGGFVSRGREAFGVDHIRVLSRFQQGELYDSRKVDDLRKALVATGLFRTVSVQPQRTGRPGPDGTEQVDLLVRQRAGPPRRLAAEAGYGTGQGLRVEGSWTHRNLFPPEGALILSAVAGTQEQGAAATFRRSNAGRRDRTFQASITANRSNYEAFEAFTGGVAARWSYDSTPIWQKRFTYAYGVELLGTNENTFDIARNASNRGTYFIAALPLFAGWDTSDDLLNPAKGYRIKANVSPESSVRGAFRPYARLMLEGTAYYPVSDDLVIAGRVRAGSIQGIERNDLAPSRRYYAGGGGSVRGFGFQELGPRVRLTRINDEGEEVVRFRPIGGRSLNEFALEARYRFGNFGIVPFIDAGQVYEDDLPSFSNLRFGAGIGGRFYTNFGPLRVDVATPLGRREGESKLTLYISIGQAF